MAKFNRGDKVKVIKLGLKNTGQSGVIDATYPRMEGVDVKMTTGPNKGRVIYFNIASLSKVVGLEMAKPEPVPEKKKEAVDHVFTNFFVGMRARVIKEKSMKYKAEGEIVSIRPSEVFEDKMVASVKLDGDGEVWCFFTSSLEPIALAPAQDQEPELEDPLDALLEDRAVIDEQDIPVAPPAPPVEAVVPEWEPQVGDRIRINDALPPDGEDWAGAGFFEEAVDYQGREGVIRRVGENAGMPIYNVEFEDDVWWFQREMFTMANAEPLVPLFDMYDPNDENRGVNIGDKVHAVTAGALRGKQVTIIRKVLNKDDDNIVWVCNEARAPFKLEWGNLVLAGENYAEKAAAFDIALEKRRLAMQRENPFRHEDKLGKYIIWNPEAVQPPQVIQTTKQEAQNVARNMANRHNAEFFVCKLESVHKEFAGHIINKDA